MMNSENDASVENKSPSGVDELWKMLAAQPVVEYESCDPHSSSCPAKAAAKRLQRFDESWENLEKSKSSRMSPLHHLEEEDVILGRILGQGSWSTAHEVFLRSTDPADDTSSSGDYFDLEQPYALKMLKSRVVRRGQREGLLQIASSDLALETKILASLQHENIISLRGVKKGDMFESLKEGSFFIVLDLLVETLETSLERWAHEHKKKKTLFSPRSEIALTRRFQDVAMGIVKAMEYLHEQDIMFR